MQGNKMLRMMSIMVLMSLAATHFSGQLNLVAPTWLWLAAFVSFIAFQALSAAFAPPASCLRTKPKTVAAALASNRIVVTYYSQGDSI